MTVMLQISGSSMHFLVENGKRYKMRPFGGQTMIPCDSLCICSSSHIGLMVFKSSSETSMLYKINNASVAKFQIFAKIYTKIEIGMHNNAIDAKLAQCVMPI